MKNKPGRKQRRKHWHEKRRIEARMRKISDAVRDCMIEMAVADRTFINALAGIFKAPPGGVIEGRYMTGPINAWRGVPAREGRG